MKNWFIEAKKSNNPDIKELLNKYEHSDIEDVHRKELKEKIKSLLPNLNEEESKVIQKDVEETKKKPTDSYIDFSFKYTEQDVIDCLDVKKLEEIYKESIKRLEEIKKSRKRPEYETYQERIDFESKSWAVERIGLQANNKARKIIFEIRKQEKMNSPLSKLAYKRNIFITEYMKGISISNICLNHKTDFSKEDLKIIINEDVIDKIQRDCDKYFGEKWIRWKNKFL